MTGQGQEKTASTPIVLYIKTSLYIRKEEMYQSNANTNWKEKILIYPRALSLDAAIASVPDLKIRLLSTLAISDPLILSSPIRTRTQSS